MQRQLCIASAMLIAASLTPARIMGNQGRDLTKDPQSALRRIESRAFDAANDADYAGALDQTVRLSKEAQATFLNEIRSDINFMGQQLGVLENETRTLTPLEQAAIEKAIPLLVDAATNTEQAIRDLNNNSDRLWADGKYRFFTQQIQQDCAQTATLLRNSLKLDRDLEKEKQLRRDLAK